MKSFSILCRAAALLALLHGGSAWGCSPSVPPRVPSPQEVRERTIKRFESGSMIGVAKGTYVGRDSSLTLTIVKSFSPALPTGLRSRQRHMVIVGCLDELPVGVARLAWIDSDPKKWPLLLTREQAEVLLDTGLIKDRSILAYVR